tara:strand:- start:329 stop:517 length:189 start_codon:yes stop_codon:yes gene_type:complete
MMAAHNEVGIMTVRSSDAGRFDAGARLLHRAIDAALGATGTGEVLADAARFTNIEPGTFRAS